jgi:hypothetical protein
MSSDALEERIAILLSRACEEEDREKLDWLLEEIACLLEERQKSKQGPSA